MSFINSLICFFSFSLSTRQDVSRCVYFFPFIHQTWSSPATILAIIALLWRLIGFEPALAAFAVILLSVFSISK
jgi:hypothetical protein